ncbi:RING/U-box superfamily protein [Euphorbia peplus]|nr:RING/U-box superfamily protein [Euphorbia peplus]
MNVLFVLVVNVAEFSILFGICYFCYYYFYRKPSQARLNDIEANHIPPSMQPNNPSSTVPLDLAWTRTQTRTADYQIQSVIYGVYTNNDISINNECSICLDELKSQDNCGVLIRCKHVYHKFCINVWLAIQDERCPGVEPSCPVCRAPVCA